ncbi:hypothetical protein [Mucilaginibacter antarcticus]|uniref:hypothetical protein n=1 Tax=Mucilaginibacter antarcticus TaxID=1855725 RepID=UPI0036404DE1
MKKLWPVMLLLLAACKQKNYNADLLIKNAIVYTVDSAFSKANAFVVNKGKIIAVGDIDSLEDKYLAREVVDAQGKPFTPVLLMPTRIFTNTDWVYSKYL